MKLIKDLLDHFLQDHHLEGLFLYMCGAITITILHIKNEKAFIKGLKGSNELFEAPEIILYLFCWIFPHVLMIDQFFQMKLSIEGWYFMGVLLLFGLTGRWGLIWLGNMRVGKETKKEDEIPKE